MKNILLIASFIFVSSFTFSQTPVTWYEIPTGSTKKLNAISFPTPNVGYIAGADSALLKTTDGGQTWTQMGMNGISIIGLDDNFVDISFIDENIGFLVAGYSGIYRTSDGGQSWVQFTGQASNMCYPHAVYPFSSTEFFAGGGGCFEGALIDYFSNNMWTASVIDSQFWDSQVQVLEFSFATSTIGLAATRGDYMLRTSDGGSSWDTIPTGLDAGGYLTSVKMIDENLCYAGYAGLGGNGFGILKSVDGGLTWAQDINSATFYYPDYHAVTNSNDGWTFTGGAPNSSDFGLILSNDGVSAFWDADLVVQPINDMTSVGSNITFAIGDSGYLVVNIPIADLGFNNEYGVLDFNLFPNPVVNKVTIQNPTTEAIDVTIHDVSGRILKNVHLKLGSGSIDCSEMTSGVYFVMVRIGNISGLKRFVKH